MFNSRYTCENFEFDYCDEILLNRYGLTHNDYENMNELKKLIMLDSLDCVRENKCPLNISRISGNEYKCINGKSGINGQLLYPCKNVNLLSFIPLIELGSNINSAGNDIWGWTQYNNNGIAIGHYAITGQTDGSSIVDITDPINPVVLAFIRTNVEPIRQINWRDLKTYKDWAYIVADGANHGLQGINLKNVISKAKEYQIKNKDKIYDVYTMGEMGIDIVLYMEISNCHNIFINENSGYLYAVGSSGMNGNTCGNALHVVDINDPYNPKFVGCNGNSMSKDYVHDTQCVIYHGPDEDYTDHEICWNFTPNLDVLTIVDVTNKSNIITLSETKYPNSIYTHQGWATSNHEYLLMDDELDELLYLPTQATYIWDIRKLAKPILVNTYISNHTVIDHNQYIIDNGYSSYDNDNIFRGFAFQSNYEAGIRILNIDNIANGEIFEIAYFDNYIWISDNGRDYNETNPNDPDSIHNQKNFRGSWSVYPYYKDNKNKDKYTGIFVSMSINTGLYVLREDFGLNTIFNDEDNQDENNQDEKQSKKSFGFFFFFFG